MIGVAGGGKWGKEIVRVLRNLGEEVKIYDPAYTTGSYEDLVKRADRIVIAAPPQHHFDLAWKSVASRKPTYVEKPLTLDFGQAFRLKKYAKGTQVGVGHILLHAEGFQRFLGMSPTKIRTYRAGFNPGYHNIPAWWDLGVHDVAACVALYGRPRKIRVEQDFDAYRAELKWPDCYAVLVGNRRSSEKRWDIEFDGETYSPYSETTEPLETQLKWWLAGGDNLEEAVTVVETLTVPNTLHRIAIGAIPAKYEEYWDRWQELHPKWTFKTWSEFDPDDYELGKYHARASCPSQLSDFLRWEILLREGGVYTDWDVEPLRAFDSWLEHDFFIGTEDGYTISPGLFGAKAGSPVCRAMIDEYKLEQWGWNPSTTGPQITTRVIRHNGTEGYDRIMFPGVHLVPQKLFYPYHYNEPQLADRDFPGAYSVHRWGHSWKGILDDDPSNRPDPS